MSIKVEHLYFAYGTRQVLYDVNSSGDAILG